MPFCEPLTTRACCHTFCRECITTALYLSPHCPIDRSPLVMDDLIPADPLLRNLVDELQVECPMQAAGCPFTGQRQLLASHLKDNCLYISVPCLDNLCDEVFPRKEAEHSAHAPRSELRSFATASKDVKTVECDDCLSQLTAEELASHRESCPDVLVGCVQAAHGCEWKAPRRKLEGHLQSCAYQAIKGFFFLHEKKLSAVSEENAVLRQRVSVLDGIVTSLQRELSTMKSALGPWYRSERRSTSNSHSQLAPISAAHTRTISPSGEGSTRSSDIGSLTNTLAMPTQPSVGSGVSASANDLSSYFPAPEPDDWLPMDYRSASHDHTLQSILHSGAPSSSSSAAARPPIHSPLSNPSTTLPYTAYSQPQSSGYSAPLPSPVAPLDLSTNLEGSLLGLRESIVTVNAALDSLARKQDVALTTESMRTAEEIRSLRAIIHGLRMQVHSIIMDRNAQATGRSSDESVPPWLPDPHEGPLPWMRVPFQPRYPLPLIQSAASGSAPKL
ncbi:hypothetical protein BC835DRAFT_1014433 [Cytidiella melzeri]|nr:hypothetical protein BC835DRAFT_1014433 [Cytidiella melzeri]